MVLGEAYNQIQSESESALFSDPDFVFLDLFGFMEWADFLRYPLPRMFFSHPHKNDRDLVLPTIRVHSQIGSIGIVPNWRGYSDP